MKRIDFLLCFAGAMILVVITGCKKEPPVTVNTSPKANAGLDRRVALPADTCRLYGTAFDKENNIQSTQWKKVSGPASFHIENPNSLSPIVKNLVQGVYQFELTVSDVHGLMDKDTIKIKVYDPNEVIIENLTWIFPWYNSIEIPNFYSIVPLGPPFTIYIQRYSDPAWIEVDPIAYTVTSGSYEYFIETRPNGGGIYHYGSLYILYYGNDVSDSPDVKIKF